MLSAEVDRYIALRRTLGYKLVKTERHLRAFARYMDDRGETHIRACQCRVNSPQKCRLKIPHSDAQRPVLCGGQPPA